MFGFRDISHDVCNVLIHVSDLRSLYVSFTFHRMSLHTCVRLKKCPGLIARALAVSYS